MIIARRCPARLREDFRRAIDETDERRELMSRCVAAAPASSIRA